MENFDEYDFGPGTWCDDEFEDFIDRTILSCYETKLKKNRLVANKDRLTEEHLKLFRAAGPYIPNNARLVEGPSLYRFNPSIDELPSFGCIAYPDFYKISTDKDNPYYGYNHICYFKRVTKLGHGWFPIEPGIPFVLYLFVMSENGYVNGERRYFTLTNDGKVLPCYVKQVGVFTRSVIRKVETVISSSDEFLQNSFAVSSYSFQFTNDRKHSWVITANDGNVKIHIGCVNEEIKSLLYARDLPLTATGRKSPIIHLVASHKRRMKSGTDIDINQFLRGTREVVINNTKFTVNPPKVMKAKLPTSGKYFKA